MKKISFLFAAGVLSITGFFAFFTKKPPSSRAYYQEAPDKAPTSPRGIASDTSSSSQASPLSIRPPVEITGHLNITEAQIQLMEQNLSSLQKDVSLFKHHEGWIVRFHQPSKVMSALGVQDQELISFQHLQNMKNEAPLQNLVLRLEAVLTQLQK